MELLHDFYVGRLGKGLTLEPTPETSGLMRRYDLLLRKEGNTYLVLYGRETWKPSSLAQMEAALGLRFVLKSENPYFLNITEIPFLNWAEERLYFHNLRLPQNAAFFLSQKPTVGAADLAPPARLPCDLARGLSNLPLTLAAQDAPKPVLTLGLKDAPPMPDPQEASKPLVSVGGEDVPLALAWRSPPKPILETEPTESPPTLCAWANFGVSPSDLGVVDVYIGRAGMMLRPPVGTAVLEQVPTYQLHFQARATRWRYHLINQEGPLPEVTQVLANGKDILALEDEGQRVLAATGQTARVFSLKEAMALDERPTQRLKLQYSLPSDGTRPNGSKGFLDLPTPDERKISPQMETTELLVFSDVFVYL